MTARAVYHHSNVVPQPQPSLKLVWKTKPGRQMTTCCGLAKTKNIMARLTQLNNIQTRITLNIKMHLSRSSRVFCKFQGSFTNLHMLKSLEVILTKQLKAVACKCMKKYES